MMFRKRLFRKVNPLSPDCIDYATIEIGPTMACVMLNGDTEHVHITNKDSVRHASACIETLQKEFKGKWKLVL